MRVLHAPFAVGGHAPTLARAERELGLDVEVIELQGKGGRRELQRWRALARALRDFDVVHFNFGSTLMPRFWPSAHRGIRTPYGWYARTLELRDIAWLQRAGKAVFVTFQGDDVRTAGDVRAREPDASWLDEYYEPADDVRKRRAATRIAAWAHGVFVLNPDLVPLVRGAEFLPYASVDLSEYVPMEPAQNPRLVVVHAPSDRRAKGTEAIVTALGASDDLDLRVLEGVPRAAVRAAIASADVVVDQIRMGWYGGLAVEAMALGRPVIAYLDEQSLGAIPREMREELPVVSATSASLEDVVRTTLARRDELGRAGRAFVERWHDPRAVARRTSAAYEAALRASG